MTHAPLQVLLVEDNPSDAYLLQKFIATEPSMDLVHVECLGDAIHRLSDIRFDAILLDLSLPDSHGLETLQRIHTVDPERPILVLTGLDDEELAIAALREGAQDYLVKGDTPRTWLVRAIHYAIERQQNFDKLQHLNQELVRSNQELEQFAYVVSHDLQQPLQVILGFARILDMKYSHQLEAADQQFISNIISSCQQMAQLIRDLLTYSRVGRTEKQIAPVDCNPLMEKVLAVLQPTIDESRAIIVTDTLPIVHANETHLFQLFENLLSNALKYCPPEQAPQVNISVESRNNEWLFGVRDNGIGIKSENFDQIFQIFNRIHHKDDYPGTGIGLATCKKIVENLGGKIWVDSEAGVGSTFYFTLPTESVPQAAQST